MDLLVLDSSYKSIGVVEAYESVIWTDRYNSYGDFELFCPVNSEVIDLLQVDRYLWCKESDRLMVIEDLQLISDMEDGAKLTITGRSLESILDRRIIWSTTVLTGNFQNAIKKLINESIISPTDVSRKISNFVFVDSTDTRVTALTIDAQYTGDNLYDVIQSLCSERDLGFKITLTDSNIMEFRLYYGTDRSFDQSVNPCVIFSPKFGNLISSNYAKTISVLKNVSLVIGEGTYKTTVDSSSTGSTGISRREMFTDASDIMKTVDGVVITDPVYLLQLKQRGVEELNITAQTQAFECEVDPFSEFVYNEDYYMGDIVQMVNEYGMTAKSRIIELVRSENTSGSTTLPTFKAIT